MVTPTSTGGPEMLDARLPEAKLFHTYLQLQTRGQFTNNIFNYV